MTARRIFWGVFVVLVCLIAWGAWWTTDWKTERAVGPSGGFYFPVRFEFHVPQFSQADPRWGADSLGSTAGSLAAEGCAVASAAMTLASFGVDVDPGRLNKFLTTLPGGYTPQGWIYWEKAAEFDSGFKPRLLPHYESLPSYFLIDRNLFDRNPVIARLRYPNGITHFVVICGKEGFDYLIRDPGPGGKKGVYPLKQFGSPIEAIRFYRKP
jgi:hypothetical protein